MLMSIRHLTTYDYSAAPARVDLLLRLWPSHFDGQSVDDWSVSVNDVPIDAVFGAANGDAQAHVHRVQPGNAIRIIAAGHVDVGDRAGIVTGLARDILADAYLRTTALTHADAAIVALALSAQGNTALDKLHDLMARVRSALAYRSGATNSSTSAADALAQGAGVCQDYAHIFIAAARHLGLPARYVVGYYLAKEDDTALHETHGWAEAWVANFGWIGFDVTNGVCPTHYHVRLASGFDATDAAPVKGFAFGGGEIGVSADVRIAESAQTVQQGQQQQ